MTSYLDFELEISPGAGLDYPVSVVRSPGGEARATMRFPFDTLLLENRLLALQNALLRSGGKRRSILSAHEQAVQDFGRALFDALFSGDVRSRYDVSIERARRQGCGLRLKLRLLPPELSALPWEFLYDPRQGEYICLSTHTPMVRYLDLPQPPEPLVVEPPLRILALVASPNNLPPLDVEREQQRLERALGELQARGMVELHWLAGQTWRDLQRELRRGPWHIFHFTGHGGFDEHADEGFLALADEDGAAQRIGAARLARLLADHRPLRLALLNACEGARGSRADIFAGSAATLVRRGLPAVLAMQYEITDDAAVDFARAFYEALADGLPIDEATTEARKAISIAVNNSVEWGVPALYMRAVDGALFAIQAVADAAQQARERVERQAQEEAVRKEREQAAQQARDEAARRAAQQAEEARRAQEREAQIAELGAQLDAATGASDWDTVIDCGEQILKLDAGHQATRAALTQAYDSRGEQYHSNEDYERAIADKTRAIELAPNAADYYHSRGVSYYQKHDYERAIADYTRAIELAPDTAKYYRWRGVSYYYKDDYHRAIADHTRAIELAPTSADYYRWRGAIYHNKRDYDRAIADYTRAIELAPTSADYYRWRGKSYHNKRDYDRAIADYTRAIELVPTSADYYWERGMSYHNKGDYECAIADHTRAIELVPTSADYYWERGASYHNKRDYDRAIADYTRAIELDPHKANYYGSRGASYYNKGDYDHAIADDTRAIELDPMNGEYHLSRGQTYRQKGDREAARRDCRRALELGHAAAAEELKKLDSLFWRFL